VAQSFKSISKEVDQALARVQRAAEVQRERRLSSKHPKVMLPEEEELAREEAATIEFRARTEDDEDKA